MTSIVPQSRSSKWVQLALGLVVMLSISSPQYTWTLFTKPFQATTGASLAAVQVAFTLLIVIQTFFSPLQGWLVDRFGAKALVTAGVILSGAGWVIASHVTSLLTLYASYGLLCGLGTGLVYVGIIGLMVRWFPDRRGFATGIVAAGYGFGAMLTTFPIDSMIRTSGYRSALVTFGIILAVVGAAAAIFLREPSEAVAAAAPSRKESGVAPREMLRTPIFWLMFVMMTMMSTGGLMVVSNFAAFARDFGVADVVVLGSLALPLALSFDRLTNGLTRPFFGWVSDRIGRENTMALAFFLEACAIALMLTLRHDPLAFVFLSGVVFFGWGEIFSLFPSTLTDTFGTRHATTNYGLLYMAQGIGSILGGPVAALLRAQAGSWVSVFILVVALDVITAATALFILKPMRASYRPQETVDMAIQASPSLAAQ